MREMTTFSVSREVGNSIRGRAKELRIPVTRFIEDLISYERTARGLPPLSFNRYAVELQFDEAYFALQLKLWTRPVVLVPSEALKLAHQISRATGRGKTSQVRYSQPGQSEPAVFQVTIRRQGSGIVLNAGFPTETAHAVVYSESLSIDNANALAIALRASVSEGRRRVARRHAA
jgi:hypothetical protein